MRDRARLAAAVNGAVVLLLPALLVLFLSVYQVIVPSKGTTVHANPLSPVVSAIEASIFGAVFMLPLALVAAWRTWVHATRWQEQERTLWGVAGAGALGALVVIAMLAPGVLVAALAKRSIVGFLAM